MRASSDAELIWVPESGLVNGRVEAEHHPIQIAPERIVHRYRTVIREAAQTHLVAIGPGLDQRPRRASTNGGRCADESLEARHQKLERVEYPLSR